MQNLNLQPQRMSVQRRVVLHREKSLKCVVKKQPECRRKLRDAVRFGADVGQWDATHKKQHRILSKAPHARIWHTNNHLISTFMFFSNSASDNKSALIHNWDIFKQASKQPTTAKTGMKLPLRQFSSEIQQPREQPHKTHAKILETTSANVILATISSYHQR